jgi:hypothetical protein
MHKAIRKLVARCYVIYMTDRERLPRVWAALKQLRKW